MTDLPTSHSTRRRPRAARTALAAGIVALAARPAAAAGAGLELLPDWPIFLFLIGLFVVLLWPIDRFLFRPLFRVIEARDEKILGARRRADRLTAEADQVMERYRAQLRDVREDAERERKQHVGEAMATSNATTAEARREAETQLERARREVAAALQEARAGLRSEAEQLARAAAERILGRTVS